jgi:tryptophan-rich sensory protein
MTLKKIDFKKLIISFAVVSGLVLISMILTKNTMKLYEEMVKPDIAPPAILFPIVWTILYSIIAITLYKFIDNKKIRNFIILNLVINVIWPVLFFRFELYLFSVIWLVLIIVTLVIELLKIYKENKIFAYLNIPYLIWLFFALYLNIMIYLLNK